MRYLGCAVAALLLAGCTSTGTAPNVALAPQGPPPVMNPATPGPSANAAYQWCLDDASRKASSATIAGRAYIRGYIKGCMTDLGADPAYTLVLLQY